ncbi:MAG: LptF/LptG family permease [Bacteroidota bacterium]
MKKLNKLIISNFFRTFLPTIVIVMFILLMQFIWLYVDELVGKGLEWQVIAELLFYWSASLIPQALPLAVLLASIMTFGNLGETYELVAAKAAGISIWKMFKPMYVAMLGISLFGVFVSNVLIPIANLKSRSLLYDVREKKPALAITEGVFYSGIQGITIRIGKKDKRTQEMYDIIIYDKRANNTHSTVISAKKGKMTLSNDGRFLFFTLYDGARYEEMETQRNYYNSFPHSSTYFSQEKIMFDLTVFNFSRTDEDLFKHNYEMLNVFQLQFFSDSLKVLKYKKALELKGFVKPYYHFLKNDLTTAIADKDSNYAKGDSVLNLFNSQYKDVILSNAESNTRTAKNVVSYAITERNEIKKNGARYDIEWHKKFVLAISCIIMFFIGAPLGSIIRKGGFGLPVVAAILLYLAYHVITLSGEKAAKTLVWTPFMGVWIGIIVLTPLGFFLTFQASNDSSLFNKNAWVNLFKRFFHKTKKI